ncbi:pentapeptide repeat-containing protein [Chachezhania antarctica]|uniref:pentapeptide repeat-containing protein n=1 Tax=Chachezhania antarctica TaxID=2340860 RepID=UPI0013CE6D8F|nr:pentapeptide repeat-containing protein [Chachezhania antarctica]
MKKYWGQAKPVAQYHAKTWLNSGFEKLGVEKRFEVTPKERLAARGTLGFPNRQIFISRQWFDWGFRQTLIGWSLGLLVVCYLVVQIFGVDVGAENLWTEFWGLIFDILIILVGFGLIQNWKQRRDDIARQEEIIEDLKRWDNEESMHRIVGAIRRLNNMGRTEVDLTGASISGAKFKGYGVSSLRGSRLSGGGWADETIRKSSFKVVDFSRLDLRDVTFGVDAWGIGLAVSGHYQDCNFWEADLRGSNFDATELNWNNPPPDTLDEEIDREPDGRPIMARTHADSFNDTDLAGASFKRCQFHWADFREAFNVEHADFSGSKGLETCAFDTEELKAKVIAQAKGDAV